MKGVDFKGSSSMTRKWTHREAYGRQHRGDAGGSCGYGNGRFLVSGQSVDRCVNDLIFGESLSPVKVSHRVWMV